MSQFRPVPGGRGFFAQAHGLRARYLPCGLDVWQANPDDEPFAKATAVQPQGQFEQLMVSIAALGRDELKKRIKDFRGRFKLDFSDDYLDSLSLDRLRHILLAALINARAHP
jgi:hypothetical protein